jgi:hypothetical protein
MNIQHSKGCHFIKLIGLLAAFSLILSACDVLGISPYYKTPGVPIKVAVNNSGEISVAFEGLEFQTPIGTFGVELDLHTPELIDKKILAVRMNNQDIVYDLNGREVTTIEFEPGYYRAINLQIRNNALILELIAVPAFNANPNDNLDNLTNIPVATARRSCSSTVFRNGMTGIVLEPVRLRKEPYIPQNLDDNWINSLQKGEKITILDVKCNDGVWLYVMRIGGEKGWAKEWGLSDDLIEITFIVPISP